MARHSQVTSRASQRPGLCRVKTRSLRAEMPFCYRYRLADSQLRASIRRSGILIPVIVTEGDRPTIISGHRRFFAAKALKIKELPAIIATKMNSREAFLLNLVSNWKQSCSEVDRAMALGLAEKEFRFTEADILGLVMPLLGLSEDRSLPEVYRKINEFPESLKDLVEDGRFPLRGASALLKFSGADQDFFAKHIGASLKLTSSQLLQAGEWLADILKGAGKSLRTLCGEQGWLKGLDVRGMDPRTKADHFFARVKRSRFPGYSRYFDAFAEQRADILRDDKTMRLEPVQGFEEPGFELRACVKTPGELDRLLQRLSEKRAALNSLFEIVL